jgi:hypothetical protein
MPSEKMKLDPKEQKNQLMRLPSLAGHAKSDQHIELVNKDTIEDPSSSLALAVKLDISSATI